MGKLDGKVAIITGGGSGFGKATAILWAKEGAKIVIADIVEANGKSAVDEIKKEGGEAVFVKVDVSKAVDAEKMTKTAVDNFDRLDILFNNAGILGPMGPKIAELNEEDMDKLIAVNIKGVLLGIKYAIPAMLKSGGGVILNTGSDSAFHGNRGIPVYVASKGAVLAFTRAIAMDYVKEGIRCNTVSPCVGRTPMHKRIIEEEQDLWSAVVETVPMGRACEPEDIAKAALFLVSDDSSFITGENLMVDGGTLVKGL